MRSLLLAMFIMGCLLTSGITQPMSSSNDEVVDLTGTDLVLRKNLLDCNLRLEGRPSNYQIVYSLGKINVPDGAVKKIYDSVAASIDVRADISGMPAKNIVIPYRPDGTNSYLPNGVHIKWGRLSDYTIRIKKSESEVLEILRQKYGEIRVVSRRQFADLDSGAVLIRSHPEPELWLTGMDGLSGSMEKDETQLYYVCLFDRSLYLNGSGQIDGIHETFSEYFNGAASADGEAGEKPYANGFAALKSLDSDNDNQFTAADEAWGNVRVWVDADHDGVTDEGELHSLDSLGIKSVSGMGDELWPQIATYGLDVKAANERWRCLA